jgi:type III secretion system (T3SS) SseB-like protein
MSVGSSVVAQPSWTPANDTEVAMAEALGRGDSQAYFRALTAATLYLPAFDEPGPQQLVTVRSGDDQYLMAFTSAEALTARLNGVPAFRTTTCAELLSKWPDPALMLAIDPETPIQAYAPIEVVRDGAARDLALTPAVAVPDGPVNALEEELDQAVRRADVDAVIGALVAGVVLVPERDGQWAPLAEQTVGVYTSAAQLSAAVPPTTRAVELPFLDLALDWPGIGWRLVVNPGGPAPLEFSGTQVLGFVEWARQIAATTAEPAAEMLVHLLDDEAIQAYLRDHRADVSGLVHREPDLPALDAGAGTHVLHWMQHCPQVCERVPIPAGDPAAWLLRAVALPHGAKLQRLDAGGRTTWIAWYDADLRRWVPMHDADRLRQALMS